MMAMNMESFNQQVLQDKNTVLVEFWAPWCVYCRRIAPAMKKLAQENGRVQIAQVNIDDEPELARLERIEVIPTLVLYQDGEAIGSIVAPESKARIEEFIQETLGE